MIPGQLTPCPPHPRRYLLGQRIAPVIAPLASPHGTAPDLLAITAVNEGPGLGAPAAGSERTSGSFLGVSLPLLLAGAVVGFAWASRKSDNG